MTGVQSDVTQSPLRLLVAWASLSAQWLEAKVESLDPFSEQACADVTDMAWSFAAGQAATYSQVLRTVDAITVIAHQKQPSTSRKQSLRMFKLTAKATARAYEALGMGDDNAREVCAAQKDLTEGLSIMPKPGLPERLKTFAAFVAPLARRNSSEEGGWVDLIGDPLDLGPLGPFADIYDAIDKSLGMPGYIDRGKMIVVAEKGLSPQAVVQRIEDNQAAFACFYPRPGGGPLTESDLEFIRTTIALAREKRRYLRSEPQFPVYLPGDMNGDRAAIVACGGLVIGDMEIAADRRPKNLGEFVVAFKRLLDEPRRYRDRTQWRFRRDEAGETTLAKADPEYTADSSFNDIADMHDASLGQPGY